MRHSNNHINNCFENDDLFVQHDLPINNSFKIDYKLEGIILAVTNTQIYSRLFDTQTEEYYDLEFGFDLISEDDLKFVEEGALFNYYTGSTIINGISQNSNLIKFRRRLKTKDEIASILNYINTIDLKSVIQKF